MDQGLQAEGFSSRSACLTSPTFGGISWLAHSSMQSGLWVDNQGRYDQLVKTDRFTLSAAFKRAGWRTVDDVPSNDRAWSEGSFYHFNKVYDRRDVGYHGPRYAYASMPDQYVLSALQRLELAKRHRSHVFAELDLVSSHTPWTQIPRRIDWRRRGRRFGLQQRSGGQHNKADALWSDSSGVRAAYGRSIQYTMGTLVSFVRRYGDPNLVLVVLGDHQPSHGRHRAAPEPRRADLGYCPRPRGAGPDRRVGLERRPAAPPASPGLADERLP